MQKRFLVPSALAGMTVAIVACKHSGDLQSTGTVRKLEIDARFQPELGVVVTQADPPPPISGGTLALAQDSLLAVAADPDRDLVYIVDIAERTVRHSVALPPKSEPGRVTLDDAGRAHVVLRNAGQLATIDIATGTYFLRPTCVAPRGVAFDRWRKTVLVACSAGDIEIFPPAGGDRTLLWRRVGNDLRDLIVREDGIHVTEFRQAKLDALTAEGAVTASMPLDGANVAWRATTLTPDDRDHVDVIVTQTTARSSVSTEAGGYGASDDFSGCAEVAGIVGTRISIVNESCASTGHAAGCADSVTLPSAVLPVDIASNGREVAVVAPGNAFTKALSQIFVLPTMSIRGGSGTCGHAILGNVEGQATALGFDSMGELIVQTREPARLHIMTDDRQRTFKTIELSNVSRADTGHEVFHANAGGAIACASCHAEGGDDAHVWEFEGIGPRRTPSLRGTTKHTEPFHWDGDMKDLGAIVEHVFQERMSGPKLDKAQTEALAGYMFSLPPPPKMRRAEDTPARGRALFAERCANCHADAMLTNNASVDVGTGTKFQVPSLVGVAWRGPWIHNGCAKTLFDRFNPDCGGGAHGDLQALDPPALADIVAFMETF